MAGSAGYSRKGTYPKRAPLIILRLARLDFAEGVLNGPTRSLDASAIDGAVVRVERQAVQCSVEFVGNRSHAGPGLADRPGEQGSSGMSASSVGPVNDRRMDR
jgi:hypothetical protein